MKTRRLSAFTLVELLASMAILAVILFVIFGVIQLTSRAWKSTRGKVEAFQGARAAFDSITQNLEQATLNTYYDYYDKNGDRRTPANSATFVPATYGRYSDLHFISGKSLVPGQVGHAIFFQTPAGYSDQSKYQEMPTLLNACGYFVEFGKDRSRPTFLDSLTPSPPERYRYRLMQVLQPSQQLSVYASATGSTWLPDVSATATAPPRPLAENVIALVMLPLPPEQDGSAPLAPLYEYDSRSGTQATTLNQLPPLVEVIMVVIEETTAKQLEQGSTAPDFGVGDLFKTADQLDANLAHLEGTLNDRRIPYRVFRKTVALRNAKWSS